jgi:hypothetical protein
MNDQQNPPTPKKKNTKSIILSIVGFIAGFVAVSVIFAIINNINNAWTPYKSSEHGFTVSFPGSPSIDREEISVNGISVPFTQYSRTNRNKSYMVAISKYPKDIIDVTTDIRGSLNGAINGSAQNTDSTIEASNNNIEFLGYPAASAVFRGLIDGKTVVSRAIYFIKDNNLYMLMTAGSNESEFDRFIESFHFND